MNLADLSNNVDPAFKRALDLRHVKQQFRRFDAEAQHSAFAPDMSIERTREISDEEAECERHDARIEARGY